MNAWDEEQLRGHVRSVLEQRFIRDRSNDAWANQAHDTRTLEFDPLGNIVQMTTTDATGHGRRVSYTYDSSGRLAERTTQMEDGREEHTEYVYDRLDRLIEEKPFVRYSYSDKQTIKAEVVTIPEGLLPPGGAIGTTGRLPILENGTITSVYDSDNRLLESSFRNTKNTLVWRSTRTYNDLGKIVSEEQMLENPPASYLGYSGSEREKQITNDIVRSAIQSVRTVFQNDEHRTLVEIRRTMGLMGGQRTAFEHNERGDISRETHWSSGPVGEIEVGTSGAIDLSAARHSEERLRSDILYSYQYDDHGNWTHRTVGKSVQIRRKFKYY